MVAQDMQTVASSTLSRPTACLQTMSVSLIKCIDRERERRTTKAKSGRCPSTIVGAFQCVQECAVFGQCGACLFGRTWEGAEGYSSHMHTSPTTSSVCGLFLSTAKNGYNLHLSRTSGRQPDGTIAWKEKSTRICVCVKPIPMQKLCIFPNSRLAGRPWFHHRLFGLIGPGVCACA